jgi:hypothetical protein
VTRKRKSLADENHSVNLGHHQNAAALCSRDLLMTFITNNPLRNFAWSFASFAASLESFAAKGAKQDAKLRNDKICIYVF